MKNESSDDADEMMSLHMDGISDVLDPETMPITTDELVEEYGDRTVEYPRGEESLASILETSGEDRYDTVDELELAILNGVGRDAVGRPRYSDRGDELGQEADRMDQSF